MIFIYFVLLFLNIVCIDIKLSLGKINNYTYPVVMTMYDNNDNNNEKNKNIDLICIYDIYDICIKDKEKESIYVKSLDTIINYLQPNDRFTLMLFFSEIDIVIYKEIIGKKTTMIKEIATNIGNKTFLNQILKKNSQCNNINKTKRNYTLAIEELVDFLNDNNIELNDDPNSLNYAQTIFFLTKGTNDVKSEYLTFFQNETNNNSYFDFSLYIFSFYCCNYQQNYVNLSFSRDGAFFPICNETDYLNNQNFVNYMQKAINDTRKVKYKMSNITIKSKYEISYFYGRNFFPKYNITESNKSISFLKFQFSTGKEYVYVFKINLDDNITFGESILNVTINYTYLNKKSGMSSKLLKYHKSINYFDFTKVKYCKALLLEEIETIAQRNFSCLNIPDICTNISIDKKNELSMVSFLREYFQK